jgi:NAD(P)-dependent dehydrogenase (short-subunit alcohol dehydrogenase family)
MDSDLAGSVCMVTGANSGIGKATATHLARRGATVVMVCRSAERGEAAQADIRAESGSDAVDLLLADLSVQADIRDLAATFRAEYDRLDVLVNNAGLYLADRQLSADGIEMTFAVNHLAPFLLTNLLLDDLRASAPARIVNVNSESHRGARLRFGNLEMEDDYQWIKAYGKSKLANLLFTFELARRLEGTGVTVNALHPGVVGTRIWNHNSNVISLLMRLVKPFLMSPSKSAQHVVRLAADPALAGVSGQYFDKDQERRAADEAYDRDAAQRLWQVSAAMTGLEETA